MPYARGTDGTVEDLPTYIRRAFGRDRTWMQEGSCHPTNRPKHLTPHTWAIIAGITKVIDGKQWVGDNCEATALRICATCPVQWSCVRWAVDVAEPDGTWGISQLDLKWLRRQGDAQLIVDAAAAEHLPVQVAVRLVRERRV